jgi:predicted TIM-barrel fold metal-dependent hydrolase
VIPEAPLLPWLNRLREEVPGVEPFDAHTHIGRNDPDEYRCEPEELIEALELVDARATVFPMHEPDGYPPWNDWVLAAAAESRGRLVAFCRVDPNDHPVAEARRALDAGARGIKLHPRAEDFTLDHPALSDLYALAQERGVPVLTHAGRGIPALGRHAVDACREHPGLNMILAHAGISDLAWIWRDAQELPNLFFDTAWWSPSDLLALFTLVPPGQILMASDAPYGSIAFGAVSGLRYALQVGLSHDQARGVLGGQIARLLAGEAPLDLGPAVGAAGLNRDPLLDRVHACLISAIGQMLNGFDARETLALAQLACEVGAESPNAELCEVILTLIDAALTYEPEPGGRTPRFTPGVHFVVFASVVARTPDVPLPAVHPNADVSERQRGAFDGPGSG